MMRHERRAFTVLEMLAVLAIVGVLLGLLGMAWSRARNAARAVREGAVIRAKIDDAILRRAIRTQRQSDHYTSWLRQQIKICSKLRL